MEIRKTVRARKAVACLCAAAMILSFVPVYSFADEGEDVFFEETAQGASEAVPEMAELPEFEDDCQEEFFLTEESVDSEELLVIEEVFELDEIPLEDDEPVRIWLPEEDGVAEKRSDDPALHSAQLIIGDHVITAWGSFPEGTQIRVVDVEQYEAAEGTDGEGSSAPAVRLEVDGEVKKWTVSYNYNGELYKPETGNYPGVYGTKITPNNATAENAPTIGLPSIADANLTAPTTESPAIIQGAAVGYEKKTGPVTYETIKERIEPYTDYDKKIIEETGADGTAHQKLTGFDGTYVIVRLDVSDFFTSGNEETVLHVKQENNRALIPGMGMMDNNHAFADSLGTKTGAYRKSDLIDKDGDGIPYIDVILFSTGKLAAGADAGKQNIANGDVPIQIYTDSTLDYNPELTYDPQSTDTNHAANVLAKFFDAAKALADSVSRFLLKGSDLALETAVENSGGENKDTGTTYWSLQKSMEDPYYDLPADLSPEDPGSGRTLKLISEVPVTEELTLKGKDGNNLKKRTLDVNSFDIQVANNTTTDTSTYTDGFYLENAWLTLSDKSNTTGAEMAIGNNAKFVIENGGKLIIDETAQLEIEWDGATTTPGAAGQTEPEQPDVLNNGLLDLRAGGEIVNNGIISVEGTEGKPAQEGAEQQASESQKGFGEVTIKNGAKLTNYGSFVVYGTLYNLGTIINNGKYTDTIVSNDPDRGQFTYHKGIQVAWKDDVTQNNVRPGVLLNGIASDSTVNAEALLHNYGDILLNPGYFTNYGRVTNEAGANIYMAAPNDAIIPIADIPEAPTIVSKRITLDPAKLSYLENFGNIVNNGSILPASVVLNDDTSFGTLSAPGDYPEHFQLLNWNRIINNGTIYGAGKGELPITGTRLIGALSGSVLKENDLWLYLYSDSTFLLTLQNREKLTGTWRFDADTLVFTLADGTVVKPAADENGDWVYTVTAPSGYSIEFVIKADFVSNVIAAEANFPKDGYRTSVTVK